MKVPEQYLPVMPYLVVTDAASLLDFAKKVFNAKEQLIVPMEEDSNKIMHGEIRIGDAVIMFADSNNMWGPKPAGMYLCVDDVDSLYKAGIENGAKSLQVPEQRPYGYSASFEDDFGNQWFLVKHD